MLQVVPSIELEDVDTANAPAHGREGELEELRRGARGGGGYCYHFVVEYLTSEDMN